MLALRRAEPAHPSVSTDRDALTLNGFFRIAQRWGLDNDTARVLLGAPAERTFFEWKRGRVGRLPEDTLRRIGYMAGIWKALEILYSAVELTAWLRRSGVERIGYDQFHIQVVEHAHEFGHGDQSARTDRPELRDRPAVDSEVGVTVQP